MSLEGGNLGLHALGLLLLSLLHESAYHCGHLLLLRKARVKFSLQCAPVSVKGIDFLHDFLRVEILHSQFPYHILRLFTKQLKCKHITKF